jgi:hypothetical protein
VSDITTQMKGQDGKLVVYREQDVEPYLEANAKAYNDAPSWRPYASGTADRPMRHVASVPMVVIEQWMKEGVNVFDPSPEMQKKIAAKLNDYTNRKLRTYPGRVGYRT